MKLVVVGGGVTVFVDSGDVLAHLLGNFVWHLFAVLLRHAVAFLTRHLDRNLPGHLGALLPGDVGARALHDVAVGVVALGLGHGAALGRLDDPLRVNRNLPANALNLAVAGRNDGGGVWSIKAGIGLSFGLALLQLDGAGWSNALSLGRNWGNRSNGSNWCNGRQSWIGNGDSWIGGGNSWLSSNVLDSRDMSLDSDELSFLADLALDVLALVDVGGVVHGVCLVDAGLLVPGGALLVGHLASDGMATLLGDGGAGGVVLRLVPSLRHRLASLLVRLGALGAVRCLVHGLANGV